jgi:hypothetical protein
MTKKSITVEYEKGFSKYCLKELFEVYIRNEIVSVPTNEKGIKMFFF